MNLPKKLINILGGTVVLGILVAGVTVVALPVFLKATDLDSQRQQEQQANASRQIQVEALRNQAKARASLDADVTGLKRQIPADRDVDSVLDTAVSAAAASGTTITAVAVQDSVGFALADGGDPETAAPAASKATATSTPSGGTATGTGTSTGSGTSAGATTGASQFRVKITVHAENTDKVTGFVEALRTGSRLLRIDGVTVTAGTVGDGVNADVTVDAFVSND